MSLETFIVSARARIHEGAEAKRFVHLSRIAHAVEEHQLAEYMADRAPLFYRSPHQIADILNEGYFRTAFREALRKLPTSSHFRNSHFGEILSAMFAEEVVGWRLIYSKLKLLTAENTNPFKMDLVFFDPNRSQPTLVLGEVKSSMKSRVPANHHKSCYPSLFDSP